MGSHARDTRTLPPALVHLLNDADGVAITLWSRASGAIGWNVLADGLFGFAGDAARCEALVDVRLVAAPPFPVALVVRHHPQVGDLTIHRMQALVLGTSLTMCLHAPADDETARRFARLRALGEGFAFRARVS